jgi:Integrase core domain
MVLVKPATVVQWHRQGFRLCWRRRSRLGRPSADREIRKLIREMSSANPLWGAPRIHGELLKLGIEISQATVAKYKVRRRGTPSPSWRSFVRNQAAGITALDMFIVALVSFRLLYVMIILAHNRRRILHTAVTERPTALWLSSQITEAFPWDIAPRYLLRDRDASYGAEFCKRVDAMGIAEVITAPRSPWQNAYVERVIGSIRRECLDHIVIFNERHLRRVTVSGGTMMIASRSDAYSRYSHTISKRSMIHSRTRFGCWRRNTMSCWRRMRFSAPSRAPPREP